MTAPPRSPRLPGALLASFDVECSDLFPGHTVVARGLRDDGRSRDDLTAGDQRDHVVCPMVSLVYEVVPGVTREEAAAWPADVSSTVDATYAADVPLPWSTGGSGPDGLPGPSGVETYDEGRWGGQSTVGELGP